MVQVGESVGLAPDTEQLPSGLGRQERAERAKRTGQFISEQSASSNAVRIWDTLSENWTGRLPRENLHAQYLLKEVWRCSACQYASIHYGSVEKHVPAVLEKAEEHQTAEIRETSSERGGFRLRCNRCDATFSRYADGQQHIRKIIDEVGPHSNGVIARLQHRFIWSPEEPFLLREVPVNGVVLEGAVGTQAERSQRRSGGRRRRRRRGR